MIITELYNGQGLGNQLWCYSVLRCVARRRGYKFGVMSPHKFKGQEFLEIDFGEDVIGGSGPEGGPPEMLPLGIQHYFKEKKVDHPITGTLISKTDNNVFQIDDNTKIEGNFQGIDYVIADREFLRSCMRIRKDKNVFNYSDPDICVIHIRGGDFMGSTAYLQRDYYENAIKHMLNINNNMKFVVITDDVGYARTICPNYEIVGGSVSGHQDINKASHHIGGPVWIDWTILYNSKNAIISASSFSWWPIWLGSPNNVIAPMYWGDHKKSDGYWSCGDSLIPEWKWLSRTGDLLSYDECLKNKKAYEETFGSFWI